MCLIKVKFCKLCTHYQLSNWALQRELKRLVTLSGSSVILHNFKIFVYILDFKQNYPKCKKDFCKRHCPEILPYSFLYMCVSFWARVGGHVHHTSRAGNYSWWCLGDWLCSVWVSNPCLWHAKWALQLFESLLSPSLTIFW